MSPDVSCGGSQAGGEGISNTSSVVKQFPFTSNASFVECRHFLSSSLLLLPSDLREYLRHPHNLFLFSMEKVPKFCHTTDDLR